MQTLIGEFPVYPSDETVRAELAEQAYAHVPFTLGRSACQELFANFSGFVELYQQADKKRGEEIKQALKYSVNDLGNGAYHFEYREPGMINPNEPDRPPGTDHKYILHYGPQTIARAKDELGGHLPAEMQVFLDNCDEFYEAGKKVLRVGAVALGVERAMFSANRDEDVHLLRVLDYQASPEENLGQIHFDRSVMTAALSESSTGLRGVGGQNGYLSPLSKRYFQRLRNHLQPITHEEYMAKLFIGAGSNRLPEHLRALFKDIPLLAHDITNDNPGETRQAVVLFGNPHQRFTNYSVPTKFETSWDDILERAA